MDDSIHSRLITSTKGAALALALTGWMTADAIRDTLKPPLQQFELPKFLALDFMLPHWMFVAVNIGFYLCLTWLAIAFFRSTAGKERAVVLGWSAKVLLTPLQGINPYVGYAIKYAQAACMMAALGACVSLLLTNRSRDEPVK